MPASAAFRVVACHECDTLHRRRPLRRGGAARCTCCGAVLYRTPRFRPDQILALVTAALLTCIIANISPIVDLSVQGIRSSTTLLGCVLTLWRENRELVAGLVFITALLFPLLELSALFMLLATALLRPRSRLFPVLFRFIRVLRPWGMIEVFMLGVVVSLIKLSHMAHVVPGPALWAFGVQTCLLAAILSFDLRSLWDVEESGS